MLGERRETGIDGRSGLVTGAASGIGLAIARRLASEGARVTLVDLPGDALAEAEAEMRGRAGARGGSRLARRRRAARGAGGSGRDPRLERRPPAR